MIDLRPELLRAAEIPTTAEQSKITQSDEYENRESKDIIQENEEVQSSAFTKAGLCRWFGGS